MARSAIASITNPPKSSTLNLPNFVSTLSYIIAKTGSVTPSKIRVHVRIIPMTAVEIPYPTLAL